MRGGKREGAGGQKPLTPDKHKKKPRGIKVSDTLWSLIRKAAKHKKISMNQYIETACLAQMQADGILTEEMPDMVCKECEAEWSHDSDEFAELQFDCPECGSTKTEQILT